MPFLPWEMVLGRDEEGDVEPGGEEPLVRTGAVETLSSIGGPDANFNFGTVVNPATGNNLAEDAVGAPGEVESTLGDLAFGTYDAVAGPPGVLERFLRRIGLQGLTIGVLALVAIFAVGQLFDVQLGEK